MINEKLIHLLSGIAVSTAMLLSIAPASLADPPRASRMAQERHACAVVLGLDTSEAPYDACVRSLDSSLSHAHQADFARSPNGVEEEPSIPVQ